MRTRNHRASEPAPLLSAKDFRQYLLQHATQIAPGDVKTLVERRDAVLAKINEGCGGHELLQTQLRFALALLTDHIEERSPQIPYYTVSLLAVALLYFMSPVDVIPDVIPGVGTSDDALMVAIAFELAAAGIERYATWKGISAASVLVGKRNSVPQRLRPRARGVKHPRRARRST
jgi:uncharacterized membrane protein YkvA (DUF1232 family)